jgi:hypothetical protein
LTNCLVFSKWWITPFADRSTFHTVAGDRETRIRNTPRRPGGFPARYSSAI